MDHELVDPVLEWYAGHARDLPWRRADTSPWAVLVSEFMLQQTPVARVLPVYDAWMSTWPTPVALAAAPSGEAVRAWGRLGYPRRALRLHAAALAISSRHEGRVPDDYDALRALPGVGDYTASAVLAFAFRRRAAVLDTNVRRVHWRVIRGSEFPPDVVHAHERRDAASLLPDDDQTAAMWSIGVMELGALVCTAREPRCGTCPIADRCAWRLDGYPEYDGPPRRGQAWAGTDRQVRGKLMAVLRSSTDPVPGARLEEVWHLAEQRDRALAGLVADGLAVRVGDSYSLPG